MRINEDVFEVIFFARGGQGAKSAVEILAQTAVKEGKFVQAFPYFGPERSGSPMKAYLRISEREILTHEPIIDPDIVIVLDETLLNSQNVTENLNENESLIINSKKQSFELISKLPNFKGKIHSIDATNLSFEIIGKPQPNAPILGKFIQITEIVKLENLIEEFKKNFGKKIPIEEIQKNVQAIRKAYDIV